LKGSKIGVRLPDYYLPVFLLVLIRILLLIAMPIEALKSYGDLAHFYKLAQLGWPFLDYWVEFPPVFPFLSRLLFLLSGGREHTYDYLLVFILLLAQAGSLGCFLYLAQKLQDGKEASRRGWIYFGILAGLSYGWWYFDPLAVFFVLLGLTWFVQGRDGRAGLALAAGTLTKLFPALAIAMVWRFRSRARALKITVVTLGVTALVIGTLYIASPEMTGASLRSQASKGSWETVWALVDGNYRTGNFGPETQRYDLNAVDLSQGNPSKLPSWITLIFFAALEAWFFRQANSQGGHRAVAFFGLTWGVFLLWSPGYSPQWTLYLLPLILLALPEREALLMAVTFVLVNLLEWPVLLSRGFFAGLWLTIPLRTFLLIILVIAFLGVIKGDKIST
jgi:hypothetical protein